MNSFSYLHTICLNSPEFLRGGLLFTLFMGGLIGGVTHCAGMCSPFVLHLGKNIAQGGVFSLWPYHLGRVLTYTLIGTMGAVFSAQISSFENYKIFSASLLILAGMLFLATAFQSWLPKSCSMPRWITHYFGAILYRDFQGKVFVTGLLLGFIPCGLVYAAMLTTASTGNPLLAMAGMIAFGMGTMPALVMISAGANKIKKRFAVPSAYAFKFLSIFNAFILFLMAGELIT